MTIQWGANTVHTFDTGSTAAGVAAAAPPASSVGGAGGGGTTFAFGGAPSAAPGAPAFPAFGSTSQPTPATPTLFGGGGGPAAPPSAAPSGAGGLFGASTGASTGTGAPVFGAPSSTSLFGTPAPGSSSGGGLFGSSSAPSSAGGGLFGGSATGAPSAFGSSFSFGGSNPTPAGAFGAPPSGGLFGNLGASSQQQQQPASGAGTAAPMMMVPAQAALQAHQNAEARQEEARVMSALDAIHKAYSGTDVCPDDGDWDVTSHSSASSSAPFTLIYYTDISPELRQQQWLQGMIVGGGGVDGTPSMVRPVIPPRPGQVSGRDWRSAAARNPDPASYMPAVLLGASALQSRIAYQQEAANKATEQLQLVRDTLDSLRQHSTNLQSQLADKVAHRRAQQKSQLLAILRKVELVRSFQVPLQSGEVQALERLVNLHRDVERTLQPAVRRFRDEARQQQRQGGDGGGRRTKAGSGSASGLGSMTPERMAGVENSLRHELGPSLVRVKTALEKEGRDVALLKKRVESAPLPALPPPPVASLRR